MRIEVVFTDDDEQAILESLCMDDEESPKVRRSICREYIQNKVAEMLRHMRLDEDGGHSSVG